MTIFSSRITTSLLVLVNLALVLFIIVRSGGDAQLPPRKEPAKFDIEKIPPPNTPPPDTLLLNGYEFKNDMWNMYPQGGEYSLALTERHATQGKKSLFIDKVKESNIEMALVHFPKNWKPYKFLCFDIYNDTDEPGTVRLRIGNYFDVVRFYVDSQKYARSFRLSPGPNTVTVPLDEVRAVMNLDVFRKSLHFNFPAGDGEKYYFDNLRLVLR